MPDGNPNRPDGYIPGNTERIVGGSKLFGEMRDILRRGHYSIRTEQAYLGWSKRCILFHRKRHPKEMGEAEIVAFLGLAHRSCETFGCKLIAKPIGSVEEGLAQRRRAAEKERGKRFVSRLFYSLLGASASLREILFGLRLAEWPEE